MNSPKFLPKYMTLCLGRYLVSVTILTFFLFLLTRASTHFANAQEITIFTHKSLWLISLSGGPKYCFHCWYYNNIAPIDTTWISFRFDSQAELTNSVLDSIGIHDVKEIRNSSTIIFNKNLDELKYFYYFLTLMNTPPFENVRFTGLGLLADAVIGPPCDTTQIQKTVVIFEDRMYAFENSEWYRTEKWHKSRKIELNEMIVHYPASKRRGLTLPILQSVGVTNASSLERMPLESWYRITFPEGLDYAEYFSNFRVLYGSGEFDRLLFDGSLPLDNSGAIPDSILKASEVIPAAPVLPLTYNLHPAYPNPFNPSTTISFDLPEQAKVNISIYNVLGQRLATLANDVLAAGNHEYLWNATRFGSGIYFVRMDATEFRKTIKITLLR